MDAEWLEDPVRGYRENARRLGTDPFRYLREVFERIGEHPHNRLDELLPDRWQAARTTPAR